MAKKRRKLSFLQKEYRKYFLKRLKEYDVKSPSQLDENGKKDFFGGIPEQWVKTKEELNGLKQASYPEQDKTYTNTEGTSFIVSSIGDEGDVELVQLQDASRVISCSIFDFTCEYTPIKAKINDGSNSPLNIALIEVSEITATLNALLRTVLRGAPEVVKNNTRITLKAAKTLLQQLATEIRED